MRLSPTHRSAASALLVAAMLAAPVGPVLAQAAPPAASGAPAAGEGRDVPVSDEAKKRFKAGVDFLKDPDGARYEEAYREFKAAYQISPSWKILGNLGLCSLKLERNSEAVEAYERYLREGGADIDPGERAQIEKDVNLVKTSSAEVTLSAQGGRGDVSVLDQRTKSNGAMAINIYPLPAGKPLKLLMQAGRHVIVAKAGGHEEKWETDLMAQKPVEHAFKLAAPAPGGSAAQPSASATGAPSAPPPSGSPLRTVGYVGAGVGGAMLLAGVVTGLLGKSKLSDLDAACPNKRCGSDQKSKADSIETLQTLTNVFLIGGGVLAAAGVTLIVVGPGESSAVAARGGARPPAAPRLSLSPLSLPQGGGILAGGSF
jgi:hypothetical protein